MKRSLSRSIVYPHPVDRVWRALTSREAIAQWLMPNDFEPVVGREFQLRADPAPGWDGVVHCVVLELDEPRTLRISWRGGPIDTVVTWRLSDLGAGGTRLEFEQTGFDGLKAVLVSFILGRGWPRIHGVLLPAVLEQLAGGRLQPPAADHPPPGRISDLIARVAARIPGRRR